MGTDPSASVLRNSTWGLASLVLGVTSTLSFAIASAMAIYAMKIGPVAYGTKVLMGGLFVLSIVLSLVGLVAGFGSLCQRDRRRVSASWGIVINALIATFMLFVALY